MSDQIIARVSESLAKEQSLESLVRQLLEMLEMVTDMESTYLTKVDVEARLQHIMFARNSQKMHIPDNFTVSWDYSLCKRAIDETAFSAMKSLTVGATVLRHAILASPHF